MAEQNGGTAQFDPSNVSGDSQVSAAALVARQGQPGNVVPVAQASVPPHANGGGNIAANMRAAIFSGANKQLKKKVIRFFGQDIEIRQQTLGAISELAAEEDDGDKQLSLVKTIIRYAYVPGTNEKVFGIEHTEELMSLPFGDDFDRLSDTIRDLTKVSVKDQEKNSGTTQAA